MTSVERLVAANDKILYRNIVCYDSDVEGEFELDTDYDGIMDPYDSDYDNYIIGESDEPDDDDYEDNLIETVMYDSDDDELKSGFKLLSAYLKKE